MRNVGRKKNQNTFANICKAHFFHILHIQIFLAFWFLLLLSFAFFVVVFLFLLLFFEIRRLRLFFFFLWTAKLRFPVLSFAL